MAELAVKAAKKLLAKSDSLADFKVRLQAWRNVPTTGTADSPSEKFFGRRQRYGLPELNQPPLPTTPREEATKLTPLTIGDYVAIQDVFNKEWNSFGTIVQVRDSGLSYEIQRDSGSTIARNRRFLRKTTRQDVQSEPTTEPRPETPKPSLRRSLRPRKPPART